MKITKTFAVRHTAGAIALAAAAVCVCAGRCPAAPPGPDGLVATVRDAVQPEIKRRLGAQDAKVREQLAVGHRAPGLFKLPAYVKCAADPWAGMAAPEAQGLRVASAARAKGNVLPAVLDRLCEAVAMRPGRADPREAKKLATLADHVRYVTAVLDAAAKGRNEAVARIPADTLEFLHGWAPTLVKLYGPQIPLNDKTRPLCGNDRSFCGLSAMQCDWQKLTGAAKGLAALADETYLALLAKACLAAKPVKQQVPGVTGDVLYVGRTDHGLILVGGRGRNTYNLAEPVAVLIDVGGDDTYNSPIAASFDATRAVAVAIDLGGDDTYDCGPFGLAAGRFGIGILIERGGNDTYKLAPGSGGAGFGGIGILLDAAGNDTYTGSKFTQGAAVAGIGLLLDLAGNDKHTSFGRAIGFGGPAGIGAVIDAAGNDAYQCGGKYPSGYNRDNPAIQPGDPRFQYTAFGLGCGQGRRIVSSNPKDREYSLAGGMGMALDLAGDDRYDSSNFSQGCGYFFGVGLKLDLAGSDTHGAARYGHAAGAHFGAGLFVDYAGRDKYTSRGPTYNGGCAWDRSAFLCIDGGREGDTYELGRSSGLGRADINAWGAFADLGGDDRYTAGGGLGLRVSRTGLAAFYDRAGNDDYTGTQGKTGFHPANGAPHASPDGGLFLDITDTKRISAKTR